MPTNHAAPEAELRGALEREGGRISRWSNPAIAPPPMLRFAKQQSGGGPPMLRFAKQSPGGGGMVEQQLMGGRPACRAGSAGRDVAPLGADVRVSRDTRRVSGMQSPKSLRDFRGPRAMPVWLHGPGAVYSVHDHPYRKVLVVA